MLIFPYFSCFSAVSSSTFCINHAFSDLFQISCHQSSQHARPADSRMLFDEVFEYDQCQNLSVAAERFYEDVFTPANMASEEPWKKPPMSVGLPTPPSTPEKCSQRLRNNMKLVDSSALNLQFYASPVHQSQNNNLQVVPDAITGDDVQDIIPFLTDLGNRSMASPNFFDTTASQGQCNSQAKHSPPLSDNVNHSPSFHADQNGVSQFHDTEQSYNHSSNIFSDCSTEGKSFSVHDFTLSKSTPYLTQPIAAMTPKYHRIPPVLKQTLFVNGQSTRALWSTLMVNSQLEIVSSNWNESLKVAKWGICVVNQAGVSLKCYSKNLS